MNSEISYIMYIVPIVVTTLLIIYAFFNYSYIIKKQHFVCPNCCFEFKPKILKLILSQNAVNGKIMRCPKCNSVKYMEPVKDNR